MGNQRRNRNRVEFPTTGHRSASDDNSYDADMNSLNLGHSPAKVATFEDIMKDNIGYTNMNLHRRIDQRDLAERKDGEVIEEYTVSINGVNSYRTTFVNTQDDSATEDLVP